MSRKREGLADLLHWSRKPCDPKAGSRQGEVDRREIRPHTALLDGPHTSSAAGRVGRPHTSPGPPGAGSTRVVSSSTGGQALVHPQSPALRGGGLPPLSRPGPQSPPGSGAPAIEPPPENAAQSQLQEALYANGHPHNATSRLFRLGAGHPGPPRRAASCTAGPSAASMPPIPSPQSTLRRTHSPASMAAALAAAATGAPPPALPGVSPPGSAGPADGHSAVGIAPGTPLEGAPHSPFPNGVRPHPPPYPHSHPHPHQHPTTSSLLAGKKMSWTDWAVNTVAAAAGAMGTMGAGAAGVLSVAGLGAAGGASGTGAGAGSSPPRAVARFGSRESGAMIEEARRLAQQAAEVLYSNEQEVTQADRAAAASALAQLEALLGSREVGVTNLSHAARSMREELGRLLHLSDKQSSFARSQLQVLERQHERLRQQLHPRQHPEPLTLPGTPPTATSTPHSTISMLPALPDLGSSPPISPTASLPLAANAQPPHGAPGTVGPALPPYADPLGAPLRSPAGVPGIMLTAEGSVPWPGNHPYTSDGGFAGGGSLPGGPLLQSAVSTPATESGGVMTSSGQVQWQGQGQQNPGDRWSLETAMERTVRLRALSAAEAAVAAVAAARAAAQRPGSRDGANGEAGLAVDVEELRRLKYGSTELGDAPPSYLGVNVRRAPSPGAPGGEAMGRAISATSAGRLGGLGVGVSSSWGGAAGGGHWHGGWGAGGAALDPRVVLQWSNRGISTSKMPVLREVLYTSQQLVKLCLAGNKLHNEDVSELMALLSEPSAPRIRDLELEQNTSLTWRCALPLAIALGLHPDTATAAAADWAAVSAASGGAGGAAPAAVLAPPGGGPPGGARGPIRRLSLHRLGLCGVRLGDKGVIQLAEGLRSNHHLRELDLRRCGLSDAGGAVLMEVLGCNGTLQRLDVSWNALRSESARALEGAMAGNAGLRVLGLAHNGFGDVDGARIVKGLLGHGTWLRVDLSYNGLGPGSCMMVSELLRLLGEAAAGLVADGTYCEAWGAGGGDSPPLSPSPGAGSPPPAWAEAVSRRSSMRQSMAQRQTSVVSEYGAGDSAPGSPASSRSRSRLSLGQLGSQLGSGQAAMLLDGNPLGHTGLRILMDGMEAMSSAVCSAAAVPPPDVSLLEEGGPEWLPPPPLHLSISHCNVAPPSDRSNSSEGDDVNPFLPSISVLCRPVGGAEGRQPGAAREAGGGGKDGGGKKAAGKGGGKDKDSSGSGGPALAPPLTLASPHLNLHSPAGLYSLDLSHPATAVLLGRLFRIRGELAAAVAEGRAPLGVGLALCNASINGRSIKAEQLNQAEGLGEGTLLLTVKAPALLSIEPPAPLSHLAAAWLACLLADPSASPLWKLGVLASAGSVSFFAPGQAAALLAGFDAATQGAEAVAAAQMLYARSCQPLAFWRHVIPRLGPNQQEALRARLGDLVALDLERPVGRYTLNLSRQVDRFVALRLQLASALEASWTENKYYINWLNATFNGQPLDRPGLTRIRDFTLPGAGVLRLDYVTYLKPAPDQPPADADDIDELLAALRGCNIGHIASLLQVRQQLAPQPPPEVVEPPRAAGLPGLARRSARRTSSPAPRPRPRMTALQLTRTCLSDVAMRLAQPPPPPPPPSPPPPPLHRPFTAHSLIVAAAASVAPSDPEYGRSGGRGSSGGGDGGGASGPPPPDRWVIAAGFNPEVLFRRTGLVLPENRVPSPDPQGPASPNVTASGGVGVGTSASGGVPGVGVAASLGAAASRLAGKSTRSMAGRAAALAAGGGRRRRRGRGGDKEGEEEEEEDANDWRRIRADYHASLLALVHQAPDLPLLVSKMSPAHLAAAAASYLRLSPQAALPTPPSPSSSPPPPPSAPSPTNLTSSPENPNPTTNPAATFSSSPTPSVPTTNPGPRAVAAMLSALPPLLACRFLFDSCEPNPCLLPPEQRRTVAAYVPAERLRVLEGAARGSGEAALQRQRAVRAVLQMWAERRVVTGEQVSTVLHCLHSEVDRVAAAVLLWPRVVDARWKPTYLKLTGTEQRQVMIRLGFWHVYSCLADPHGVRFLLDLTEPEQRDIARELVKGAVKETARARQEAKARGAGYAASTIQTLLDLHGNGNPVSIPEDEKLWGMAESNFKTMEFLYVPTLEQSMERVAACAVRIQRAWRTRLAAKRAAAAREAAAQQQQQGTEVLLQAANSPEPSSGGGRL